MNILQENNAKNTIPVLEGFFEGILTFLEGLLRVIIHCLFLPNLNLSLKIKSQVIYKAKYKILKGIISLIYAVKVSNYLFLKVLELLLKTMQIPEQLSRTILIFQKLDKTPKESQWKTLYNACFENIQSVIALSRVLISSLKALDQSPNPPEESLIEYNQYLEELKQLLKTLPHKEINEYKSVVVILEELLKFIAEIPTQRLREILKESLIPVLNEIFKNESLLNTLLSNVHLTHLFMEKFLLEQNLVIFQHFIEVVFVKLASHIEFGEIFFSKVKSFLGFLSTNTEIKEEENYSKGFLLLCHVMVTVINCDTHEIVHPDFSKFNEQSSDFKEYLFSKVF